VDEKRWHMPAIPVEPDRSALSDAITARRTAEGQPVTDIYLGRTSARLYGNVGSRERFHRHRPGVGRGKAAPRPYAGRSISQGCSQQRSPRSAT
jgi:hypothetical protein